VQFEDKTFQEPKQYFPDLFLLPIFPRRRKTLVFAWLTQVADPLV
jgi:hypothetical protein